jgi:hypothetical protein
MKIKTELPIHFRSLTGFVKLQHYLAYDHGASG